MEDTVTNIDPLVDPEKTWPSRFGAAFIGFAALALTIVFAGISVLLRMVFDSAHLFTGTDAAPVTSNEATVRVLAFALLVIVLLLLHVGALFALIEAKTPPMPVAIRIVPDGQIEALTEGFSATALPFVNVGGQLEKITGAIAGKRNSTTLFSLGFVLVLLAAAGSGLVNISVGTDDGTGTPGATTTSSSTTQPTSGGDLPSAATTTSSP